MKKTIVAIAAALAALFFSTPASAQLKIGPKAGLATSWMPGTNLDPGDRVRPHNSFYGGVSAEYGFAGNFVAQMEVLYTGKGHSDRTELVEFKTWNSRYNLELGYVVVPVYVGYRFLNDQISIMLGPEFGVNVVAKGKKTMNKDIYPDIQPVSTNVKNTVRPFNVGLGLQVSYDFLDGLGVDAKVSWGMNRTFRDGMNAAGNIVDGMVDKGHNFSIQVGLFYKFEI